ncbi:hypothetical protein Tco_1276653 [Tanacetum coccineum]
MKGQDNPLIPNPHPHLLNSTIKKPIIVPSSYQPKKTHKPRKAIRTTEISQSSGPINLVADETVYKEWEDRMERAATTASSLDAEQDSGNINRTQSMATLNESFPQGTDSGSGPRGYTLGSGEDSMKLLELMELCTKLSDLFWQTASTSTLEDGEVEITTTIVGQLKTITEASLRIHLKLEDADGISSLPNTEIFVQLALMGYASDSDKLTFQKGHFSPQWRFLIHIILHCVSPKKTAWEQFSSNIAIDIICLATNRTFNFSKMIFEGMGGGSIVPVEFHHTPITTPSTSQPPLSSPSRVPTPPYDLPLLGGHTPGSDEGRIQQTELMDLDIKLSNKVLALETDLQQTKKVYSTTVTKHIMKGRMIDDIDQDARITLVTPTKTSTQEDHPKDQLGVLSAAKVLTDVARVHTYSRRRRTISTGSGEVSTASKIVSTAKETVSTAGASMPVSTAGLVQEITSSSRASKDKGKAVIT